MGSAGSIDIRRTPRYVPWDCLGQAQCVQELMGRQGTLLARSCRQGETEEMLEWLEPVFIFVTRVALFLGVASLLVLRLRPLYLRYRGRRRRRRQ